jgi:alanine-synthesizing transaminase
VRPVEVSSCAPGGARGEARCCSRVAKNTEPAALLARMVIAMQVIQSTKLANVCYEIRGPVLEEAMRLEAAGHRILKLNTGNPAAFGFDCPPEILEDMLRNIGDAHGYGDAKGLLSARRAVMQHYQTQGIGLSVEDIYLGNGVSELIQMSMQALLDDGDEVLVPAPDYPLWTASVSLAGGTAVHYRCDEQSDWMPDLADIERKVTDRTKALVIINPNNPTGAVYSQEMVRSLTEIARRHNLVVCSDEIYDKILYDDATHTPTAAIAPDLLTLTFNGLSKAYRVAGYRSGWLAVCGPKGHAASYIEGLTILANMRLCANMPAQHAVATALGGHQSINDLVLPGGRLREQRDVVHEMLTRIPGVTCVKPKGAIYAFPRLDPKVYKIKDDRQMVLDLLRNEKIMIVHGTGFNWPEPDHFRIVALPAVKELADAVTRIGTFLDGYSQH